MTAARHASGPGTRTTTGAPARRSLRTAAQQHRGVTLCPERTTPGGLRQ
jgi:hypothetical protein